MHGKNQVQDEQTSRATQCSTLSHARICDLSIGACWESGLRSKICTWLSPTTGVPPKSKLERLQSAVPCFYGKLQTSQIWQMAMHPKIEYSQHNAEILRFFKAEKGWSKYSMTQNSILINTQICRIQCWLFKGAS